VTRRTTTLADVEEPSFGRKAFMVMTKPGIFAQVLACFGDERAVPRYLERSELRSR